ncbi:ImuA family protein [Fuerstiella marisgermanici]|uniref:Recombinase A n=1 Tax=Fuerstiella marisgermanici TaxID=1891926 RepID=A0A1P8WAQ0_9PLAN|nr:hypothetical protein [Fuerstiella marisgermanici]APZ91133.1 hypothetical protein Fuma_00719 [Fuerstiella marisgermanici]
MADRSTAIQNLRADLCQFQHALRLKDRVKNAVSTGISALDNILPDQGLLRSTLSEWIAAEPGSGTISLAMRAAGQAQHEGPLIIVDRPRRFYAPAFPAVGVCLRNTILVRPKSRGDELWAVEQSLRCPGVGAVMCQIDRLRTQEFRRLQLAAESGTAVGLLIRPASARRQSGWADVRLLISAGWPASRFGVTLGNASAGRSTTRRASNAEVTEANAGRPRVFHRRLEVRCVYAKGAMADQTVELEVCDETNTLRLAAKVSDSTAALQAAGA